MATHSIVRAMPPVREEAWFVCLQHDVQLIKVCLGYMAIFVCLSYLSCICYLFPFHWWMYCFVFSCLLLFVWESWACIIPFAKPHAARRWLIFHVLFLYYTNELCFLFICILIIVSLCFVSFDGLTFKVNKNLFYKILTHLWREWHYRYRILQSTKIHTTNTLTKWKTKCHKGRLEGGSLIADKLQKRCCEQFWAV